jgi:DnaK suppressor protein
MPLLDTHVVKVSLQSKYNELAGASNDRDSITAESVPDPLDHVQLMGEREMVIHTLDRNAGLLRQIRHAFTRLDNGTYGVCARCEDDIAPKRIAAVPWAAFCIKCQEHLDQQKSEGGDDAAELYEDAA